MTEPTTIKTMLVDDDALVRAGLRLILGAHPEIVVVGECGDGETAIAEYERLRPDVVLMDIRMPQRNGLSSTAAILERFPEANIIVLTTFDTDEFVVKALKAGARGFLLKDTEPRELIRAVRLAAQGHATLSPSVISQLVAHISLPQADPEVTPEESAAALLGSMLTERELDVAVAIARGLSNSDIARDLYLSVPTVKTHVSHIFAKLDVDNRVQVAIRVHEAGLIA